MMLILRESMAALGANDNFLEDSQMNNPSNRMRLSATKLLCTCAVTPAACTSLGSSGPSSGAVRKVADQPVGNTHIKIVELTAPGCCSRCGIDANSTVCKSLGRWCARGHD